MGDFGRGGGAQSNLSPSKRAGLSVAQQRIIVALLITVELVQLRYLPNYLGGILAIDIRIWVLARRTI